MAVLRVPVESTGWGTGQVGVNVWHVRTVGAGGLVAGELQQAVDAIHTFYATLADDAVAPGSLFPLTMKINLGTVTDVETQVIETPTWTEIQGESASGWAPQHLALSCSWQTSIAARRARGRTFLGPLAYLSMNPNGSPEDPYLQKVRDAAQALIDSSTAANDWAVAVWGLEEQQNWPLPVGTKVSDLPHVARDIIGARVRDQFAVMRSRRD